MKGSLAGVRVLDLSRILAGPTCTQLLGDLGADVIKVERPGHGDDTRRWGPPFVKKADGTDSDESAYYLCANRNKRSIAVDFRSGEGSALIRRMAKKCHVLVENYRTGSLEKYGLGYEDLRDEAPHLVYCSISGFGRTGPRKDQPGYDFLAQAMAGTMSLTGEPAGEPVKVGVGIGDVMCGMYATSAVLAALRHAERTGEGQHVDLALYDATVAWLINAATNTLVSGNAPKRYGNAHPNIVPYQVFETSDGHVVIAVGNDGQFQALCAALGEALHEDERFLTNADRLRHRDALIAAIVAVTKTRTTDDWIDALVAAGVPCGPVNDLPAVFDEPQTKARGMVISMAHAYGEVKLLGNPLNLSATPVRYRRPPPLRGEHTNEVLKELGETSSAIEKWRRDGVVE
ncbi:MAG: CaiB/BaiF CoA-transferase family protein [Myxococcota bacterium]